MAEIVSPTAGSNAATSENEATGWRTLLWPQVVIAQATELARGGRYAAAEGLLQTLPEAEAPPVVWDLRARIYAQQGQLTEAEGQWLEARRRDPHNAAYAAGLAEIARRRHPLRLHWLWPSLGMLALAGLVIWLAVAATPLPARTVVMSMTSTSTPLPAATPTPIATRIALPVAEVRAALQADPVLAELHLSVWQEGAVLYLGGVAPQLSARLRAEALAAQTPGVGPIDSTGVVVDPGPLAARARAALADDAATASLDIQVTSNETGMVVSGVVADEAERKQVLEVVRAAAGVRLVDDSDLMVASPLTQAAPTLYTVQEGDSLVSIATQFYGSAERWPLVFAANRDLLRDPNRIDAGMVLVIPPAFNG